MANTFRSSVGGYRRQAFQDAMNSLGGGSAAQDAVASSSSASADNHLDALNRANAWQGRTINTVAGFGARQGELAANAMGTGLEVATTAAANAAEAKAAKAAQRAQQGAGVMGLIGQAASIALPFLCERRLKTNIRPLSAEEAWDTVRDLPLYSFSYTSNPNSTSYGPIIDEVETVNPSLVRPSLLPDDEVGPIRGFDVMRHQALESIALQRCLQRIEELELRLFKLELTNQAEVQDAA